MMMMVLVMSLLTLGPFRTEESSSEVIFIKFLDQGLGISVKGLAVLLRKKTRKEISQSVKWSYYGGQRL